MDKNPNRPNKGRKNYNFNQMNSMGFPYGKKVNPIPQMINYENMNPPFVSNEEYINQPPPPTFSMPNTKPTAMPARDSFLMTANQFVTTMPVIPHKRPPIFSSTCHSESYNPNYRR